MQNPFEVGDEVTFFHNNKVIEGIVADIGWYRTLIRSFEVCACVCMCLHVCVHACVYVFACVCACMCVCVCVHVHAYVCSK